jgi:hypothetical protein
VERFELDDGLRGELVARGAADGSAPADDAALARYAVYLGAAYLEAEQAAGGGDPAGCYATLHRMLGAVGGGEAALRFAYAEEARRHAGEQRAAAAHDRMASAYVGLIEKLRAEIAVREARVARLAAELAP